LAYDCSIKLKGAPTGEKALIQFTKELSITILFLIHVEPSGYAALCAEQESQCFCGTNAHNLLPTDLCKKG
jgi:hypothetical protein